MSSILLCNPPHSSVAADTTRRYQPDSRRPVPSRNRSTKGFGQGKEDCNATEAELLSKAQDGDQQAFVDLCNRYSRCVWGRIARIVKNHEDTEDMFQETVMRAYKHLKSFRGSCSFQTWITQIAINTSLMLLRKRKYCVQGCGGVVGKEGEILDLPEVADPSPNPEQIYCKVQRNRMLSAETSKLPAGFRPLMDLYYGEENSLIDAAEALGMTVAAAKARLVRARVLLRHRLRYHPLMSM